MMWPKDAGLWHAILYGSRKFVVQKCKNLVDVYALQIYATADVVHLIL